MKVCEIFESIQGEGKYAGYPVLFIRMSGCNRQCDFCDSKFHKNYYNRSIKWLVNRIKQSKKEIVVWTGGEPIIQIIDIYKVILKTNNKQHHLETNGDLIDNMFDFFNYICVSPKCKETIEKLKYSNYDIKVVTDLKINKNLIPYATMLMPLTTFNEKKDKIIKQKVWNYCVKHNIKFCLRQHVEVWQKKKGV